LRITSAQAEIGDQTIPLEPQDVEPVLGKLRAQLGDQAEVIIRILVTNVKRQT
jgi:hypothetical protein